MKSTTALILPAILAVAAGVLNFLVLQSNVNEYVVAKKQLASGEKMTDEAFQKKSVRGEVHGAILWTDRAVLNQLPAPRTIEIGEYVFRQDIVPKTASGIKLDDGNVAINISLDGVKFEDKLIRVGQVVGFVIGRDERRASPDPKAPKTTLPPEYEIVGPYKVVTLGSAIADDGAAKEEDDQRPSTLSIQIAETLDEKVKRLLEANSQRRIAAVVFYGADKQPH